MKEQPNRKVYKVVFSGKDMSLITKYCGHNVEGEALERLLVAIGQDPEVVLGLGVNAIKGMCSRPRGKVILHPASDGVNVELYLSTGALFYRDPATKRIHITGTRHISGKIPYTQNTEGEQK